MAKGERKTNMETKPEISAKEAKLAELNRRRYEMSKTITALKNEIKAEREALRQRGNNILGKYVLDNPEIYKGIYETPEFKAYLEAENATELYNSTGIAALNNEFDGDVVEEKEDVSEIEENGEEKPTETERKRK
jgi:hypothetical protein